MVSLMPFRAILLFFLAAGAMNTTPAREFTQAMLGTSARGANNITPTEKFMDQIDQKDQSDSAPKQPHASRKHAKREAQTQTLTGTVEWEYKPLAWDCDVPNCDHFALYDDATQSNYELDDARAALPYEGKRVKVTGVVNTKDSVIHVLTIEPTK
jgi:hypothetical protein